MKITLATFLVALLLAQVGAMVVHRHGHNNENTKNATKMTRQFAWKRRFAHRFFAGIMMADSHQPTVVY